MSFAFLIAVVITSVELSVRAITIAMLSVISIYMRFLSCEVENLPRLCEKWINSIHEREFLGDLLTTENHHSRSVFSLKKASKKERNLYV